MAKILIIEDETDIREMLAFALKRANFEIVEAGSVEEGRTKMASENVDLILLDWMLPQMSGIDFARVLQKDDRFASIPVIMVTAKSEEANKIKALDTGADDYLTKPFSTRELVARIKAVLRRTAPSSLADILECENLKLDTASHRVTVDGAALELGPTEFKMLKFMMSHPDRVYSRAQLLDYVWGANVYIEERTVDVHIRRLRKALSQHGVEKLIQTVRGSGYRFSSQV